MRHFDDGCSGKPRAVSLSRVLDTNMNVRTSDNHYADLYSVALYTFGKQIVPLLHFDILTCVLSVISFLVIADAKLCEIIGFKMNFAWIWFK